LGKTSVHFATDSESDCLKNCYPGARVDSDTPIYQLFDKELWSTFTFKERYAGWRELRRYFEHVEKVWDVKKDVEFNKHVDSAVFDEQRHQWLVECSDGTEIYCRWFILGTWSRDQQSTGSPPSLELLSHLEFCLDDHQKYIVPLFTLFIPMAS
jgi:hypothetical protein